MDFRNKYLKYSPKITFYIFEKVWNKLIESGYLPFGEHSVKKAFGDFKTLHRYFRTTESHPMEFNCYSVIPILDWSETTVQEILGYDPFVRNDDFVLPEKWYVEVNTENKSTLNDWKIKQQWPLSLYSFDYEFIVENGGGYIYEESIKDRVKITFDQFKKYVLKQDVEESTKIDYYRCIKADFPELVLGKIYPSYDGKWVKIPNGEYTSCFDVGVYRFELSTKSAFDAQNQPKQPLKQAVHCETQEQWDFVTEKLRYKWGEYSSWSIYKNNTCIGLEKIGFGTAKMGYKEYQILSFSDWCAQNNYEFQPKLENFYVVCETEKESDLCLMWAVDNGLVCDTRRVFISRDFNVFEVYNGKATINMRLRNVSAKNNKDFEDIIQQNLTSAIPPLSEQTANNLSETIDRVRYMAMQTNQSDMLENALKSLICEIQHYDHEFLAQMSGGKVSKVNQVQISTDNEIKINITQKQSIKI